MKSFGRDDIRDALDAIAALLGQKWIERKLREEESVRQQIRATVDNRKHSYLLRKAPHPLILWCIFTRTWLDSPADRDVPIPQSTYRLAVLAAAIASAKGARGFENLVPRLKRESEFESAGFEAVVAASYVDSGYDVEFVPVTPGAQTPDLRVRMPDGHEFWVECKCRDVVAERDRRVAGFWRDLQSLLMQRLGPSKTNVMIAIKCLGEPAREDLKPLRDFVLDRIRVTPPMNMFREPIRLSKPIKISPIAGEFRAYEIAAQVIAPPDEEYDVDSFGFNCSEDFEYFTSGAECMHLVEGGARVKNPFCYAFKVDLPSDVVPGILNTFKSAVDQLPREGPGVVWLKIPDGAWGDDLEGFMSRVVESLRRELSGDHNRRVNAVIIHARGFDATPTDGDPPIYRSVQLMVEHANPRNAGRT